MHRQMRKFFTGLAVVAGLIVLSATPAEARPVQPGDDYISGSDVGPDKRDWFCTYQWQVDDIACTYQPGNGSTSGKALMEKPETVWWNPWTWSW